MAKVTRVVGGVEVSCLGEVAGRTVLVVISRMDKARRSAGIDAVLSALHARGLSVCWYESRIVAAYPALQHGVLRLAPRRLHPWLTRPGALLRKVLKAAYALCHPRLLSLVLRTREERHHTSTRELARFVRALPAERVVVLSHSAGGIAASLIADATPVDRLVCFGYPFKHPDRDGEPRRTAHLARLKTPFLILQGDRDRYGTADDAARHALSPAVRVVSVAGDHDYDPLAEDEVDRCVDLVDAFLAG